MVDSGSGLLEELAPIVERACAVAGLPAHRLIHARRLSGGAINQNFLLEVEGEGEGPTRWVMRRGLSQPIPGTHGRAAEFALFEWAQRQGLTVPRAIALIDSPEPTGASTSVFEWRSGEADGRALMAALRDSSHRAQLTRALGRELGRMHSEEAAVAASQSLLTHIGERPIDGLAASMQSLRESFALVRGPAAYLRFALDGVLEEAQTIGSPGGAATLCHNDFRLGNLMMDASAGELTAVLDWEFAAWGDVMADIGWLTAPCWRFGGTSPVAGFGELEDLVAGLEETLGERRVNALRARLQRELPFWQRLAHLRWAIIAAQQGERVVSKEPEALELMITGAMAASIVQPVVEHYLGGPAKEFASGEVLQQECPEDWTSLDVWLSESAAHLKMHLASSLQGSAKYSALMAANAIRMARAQLRLALRTPERIDSSGRAQVAEALLRDLAVWTFRGD